MKTEKVLVKWSVVAIVSCTLVYAILSSIPKPNPCKHHISQMVQTVVGKHRGQIIERWKHHQECRYSVRFTFDRAMFADGTVPVKFEGKERKANVVYLPLMVISNFRDFELEPEATNL
jgi:hypothetical protein